MVRRGNTFLRGKHIRYYHSEGFFDYVLIIFSVMSLGNLPSHRATLADSEMVLKLFFKFATFGCSLYSKSPRHPAGFGTGPNGTSSSKTSLHYPSFNLLL